MSIRKWIAGFRERRDAAAVERAAAKQNESPHEQAITHGDPTGLGADVQAARASGQTPGGATDVTDVTGEV